MHVVFDLIVGAATEIEDAFALLLDGLLKDIGIIIIAQDLRAIGTFLKTFRHLLDCVGHYSLA